VAPHFDVLRLGDGYWDHPLPHPELWHYDDVIWLERSTLGPLMRRAERGEDIHALVTLDAAGIAAADALGADDIKRFWNDFMPRVAARHKSDWHGLRATVTELRVLYGRPQLHRFERVAARYGVLAFARMQPLFLAGGLQPVLGFACKEPRIEAQTNYHLRMLACHLVLEGRAALDTVMAEPLRANEHLQTFTLRSGSYLDALFNYEQLVFRAQRLRALHAFTEFEGRIPPTLQQKRTLDYLQGVVRRAWGIIDYGEFLKGEFTGPEDQLYAPEALPAFQLTSDHEVVRRLG
jgi:hypothetical protein